MANGTIAEGVKKRQERVGAEACRLWMLCTGRNEADRHEWTKTWRSFWLKSGAGYVYRRMRKMKVTWLMTVRDITMYQIKNMLIQLFSDAIKSEKWEKAGV